MEAYERANARGWDLVSGKILDGNSAGQERQTAQTGPWRAPQKPQSIDYRLSKQHQLSHMNVWQSPDPSTNVQRPFPQAPNLNDDSDDEARRAWRNREPPTDHIRIPIHLILLKERSEEDQFSERKHETIARSHGVFISNDNLQGGQGAVNFDLWGEKTAVAAAKRGLNQWIAKSSGTEKSTSSSKWSKIYSLTEIVKPKMEKRWRREVAKQKFRRLPPPGSFFEAVGNFHWPSEELRHPEEILGRSFEALDPVRMEFSCYVVFNKESSVFQVSGKSADVKQALLRLRNCCFQIAARQGGQVRQYLVYWPGASTVPSHVSLVSYRPPSPVSGGGNPLLRQRLRGNGKRSEASAPVLQPDQNENLLKTSMAQVLHRLQFFRGQVKMNLRLGTFVLESYMQPEDGLYEIDEYHAMVQQSQFKGSVTQELGNISAEENLLSFVQKASDILSSQNSYQDDLKSVEPTYSSTYVFSDGTSGNIQLTVFWNDARYSDRRSTATTNYWARLDRDSSNPTPLADINLTDIATGLAWSFQVHATQAIDTARIPTDLVNFAANIRISAEPRRTFPIRGPGNARLKSLQQRTTYKYGFRNSDYTLEVECFQDFIYTSREGAAIQTGSEVVYEPRWSLNVHRPDWDSMLAQNASLGIGERARWQSDLEDWFPRDYNVTTQKQDRDGLCQLTEKLVKIKDMVAALMDHSPLEDRAGCMAIG